MSRVIFFDCFSGISGDMALGALLHAGLPLHALRAELDKLNLDGWRIDAEPGMRSFLAGTRALVHAPEQHVHRHLADVRAIIEGSALTPPVKQRSMAVFTLLAQAEGQVHGTTPEQVHFHEVGALDAIVDIVGVVAGLDLLGVEAVYASPLPLGHGWVRAAHGMLPIPAPATLNLLAAAGAPIVPDDTPFELVTPTGAALLAALATFRRPAMRLERIGYGLGKRDLERPNALRVWLGVAGDGGWGMGDGETRRQGDKEQEAEGGEQEAGGSRQQAAEHAEGTEHQLPTPNSQLPTPIPHPPSLIPHPPTVVLLQTNIDNQPAEQLAYVAERMLAQGALDVWQTPIQMKKNRAGTLFSALVAAPDEAAAVALLMRETTTLGVRRAVVERHVCERAIATLATPLGEVRVKRKRWAGEALGAAPEYEDCARLARQHGISLRAVYALVEQCLAALANAE